MTSPKRKQITVRINKDMDEFLENKIKSIGISKNAFIIMAINRALKDENLISSFKTVDNFM